ncbi:hypothetical protein BCR44DRAFT_290510 [Catenaria anguillulae PL171]|nr:hypothetical protein BCR44DRAFT_290510 [Catenaria anguillulae PL171]
MLPYMFLTSRPSTRWFLLGTDATIWLPGNVLAFLNTLPIDPLHVPAFFADPSPRTQSIAGGGIIISYALAKLVHQHADLSCSFAAMMETGKRGDDMLRECIDRIMRLSYSSHPHGRTNEDHANATTTGTGMDNSPSPPLSLSKHHQVRTLTRLPMFNSIDMHNTRDGIDLLALSGSAYLAARLSRAAPFTLHNLLALPPAQFGVYNRRYGAYKLWHLVSRLPGALQFRRFFIHLDPHHHGTAVFTYGLSVRVYEMKVESLDHTVDLDNKHLPVGQVGGIEWVLDEKIEDVPIGIKDGSVDMHAESNWPHRHSDYEEYWLAEVDERDNKMVYVCERLRRKFMLQVKCAGTGTGTGMGATAESALPMFDMQCPAVV